MSDEREEEVVHAVPFATTDTRWSGAVEVVRTSKTRNGTKSQYVDFRIRIGSRYLLIPRQSKALEEIMQAVQKAAPAARKEYDKLLSDINKTDKD